MNCVEGCETFFFTELEILVYPSSLQQQKILKLITCQKQRQQKNFPRLKIYLLFSSSSSSSSPQLTCSSATIPLSTVKSHTNYINLYRFLFFLFFLFCNLFLFTFSFHFSLFTFHFFFFYFLFCIIAFFKNINQAVLLLLLLLHYYSHFTFFIYIFKLYSISFTLYSSQQINSLYKTYIYTSIPIHKPLNTISKND